MSIDAAAARAERQVWMERLGDFVELTKPRIATMVLLTVVAGGFAASNGVMNGDRLLRLFHAVVGTALVAAGSCALNQLAEKDVDARMQRTQRRPLPAGRISTTEAAWFGAVLSLAGAVYTVWYVDLLTASLAVGSWIVYVLLYTPMKRYTSLNTVVGAVSGALPPTIGWVAVRGSIDPGAVALFAILFFWQFPHFLAIAWLYREDYAAAGLKMLPTTPLGRMLTGFQTVSYCLALVPVSVAPSALGVTGPIYFWGTLAAGLQYLVYALIFQWKRTDVWARHLLWASLLYLPIVLMLMMLDVLVY
jgi:protoheme IX farnesyltransferase